MNYNKADLTQALISTGGDVRTLTEVINHNQPPDEHITEAAVLQAFIDTVSLQMSPDAQPTIQDTIKAMMLFNFLQILNTAKEQLLASAADFSPTELINTIKLVVEGVSGILTPSAPQSNNNQFNILNFNPDALRNQMEQRLKVYNQLKEASD